MNIQGLFDSIDQYLNWLDTATEPEQISGLIDSISILIQFLFAFLFGGN